MGMDEGSLFPQGVSFHLTHPSAAEKPGSVTNMFIIQFTLHFPEMYKA